MLFQSIWATLPRLFQYLLVFLLLLFISLFFPNKVSFRYEYQLGERWKYEDLEAPFDYPILKYDNEIATEQAIFRQDFVPYYTIDSQIVAAQKDSFFQNFKNYFSSRDIETLSDTAFCLKWGLNFIEYIYQKKIIELHHSHKDKEENFSCILLSNNVELGEFYRKDFIDNQQTAQILVDTLSKTTKIINNQAMLLLLNEVISLPNILYDSSLTFKKQTAAQQQLSRYRSMVKTGELIVVQQGVIDSVIYSKLISLQKKYNEEINQHKSGLLMYAGYFGLTLALLTIYVVFIRFYNAELLNNIRQLSLLLFLIAFYSYLSYIINQTPFLNQYLIPFCIVPIIILNFFSAHLALFTHTLIVLLASMLLSLDYQFILLQLIAGMVAIITKLKTRYLTDFFASVLYIGATYVAVYLCLELTRTGVIFPIKDSTGLVLEQGVRFNMLIWIALNVFLTLLSFPIIPMLEKIFGLTSEITLVELSDINKPLLKELGLRAAGTLQHSLQVAHLAETAANAINANALLVRVAALYHDIGKMSNPEYFIENQHGGNPHDKLTYLESATMIIGHVTNGVLLAKKHNLPPLIIDFILTHHGTTRVEYFYRKHLNENPTAVTNEKEFTYPGPRPQNREQAILMMADSLEAASRSLLNPTEKNIDDLIENIIKGKIAYGQFSDSNLSFKELEIVKNVFRKQLKSIHHVRIAYPNAL